MASVEKKESGSPATTFGMSMIVHDGWLLMTSNMVYILEIVSCPSIPILPLQVQSK